MACSCCSTLTSFFIPSRIMKAKYSFMAKQLEQAVEMRKKIEEQSRDLQRQLTAEREDKKNLQKRYVRLCLFYVSRILRRYSTLIMNLFVSIHFAIVVLTCARGVIVSTCPPITVESLHVYTECRWWRQS